MRELSSGPGEVPSFTAFLCALGLCTGALACGSADSGSLERASGSSTQGPNAPLAPSAAPGQSSALAEDPPLLGGACTGQVAEQTFASALCSCEDTNIAGY